jgi:3'5'-cyclic nucleotide phosphodiesterase
LILLLDLFRSIDKSKALSLVLHCCDISHPAKRWTEHHQWTSLLLEEFFLQGERESDLGLPFSPLCDRKNTLVAESQIGKPTALTKFNLPTFAVSGVVQFEFNSLRAWTA